MAAGLVRDNPENWRVFFYGRLPLQSNDDEFANESYLSECLLFLNRAAGKHISNVDADVGVDRDGDVRGSRFYHHLAVQPAGTRAPDNLDPTAKARQAGLGRLCTICAWTCLVQLRPHILGWNLRMERRENHRTPCRGRRDVDRLDHLRMALHKRGHAAPRCLHLWSQLPACVWTVLRRRTSLLRHQLSFQL
jgi:hypothetical protein